MVQDDFTQTKQGLATVSTRPGAGGVLCILSFSIFLYDMVVNFYLPVDPTVEPAEGDSIRESLLK